MKKNSILKILLISTGILTSIPALANEDIDTIFKDGNFFGEARYRYEMVDQDGFTNKADASTLRTNIGFTTGEYKNFQAQAEVQFVNNIGSNGFNDTVNNKNSFPTVADPDTTEINELWLNYTGFEDTFIKIGRQKVNLDNQRFVGTVNWRQNDQTFDTAMITNSSIPHLNLAYAFIGNINRIQGNDHALGDLDTETHLVHATYNATDWMDITGYTYWLDIDSASALSSKTYGLRFTGDTNLNNQWDFFYEAEAAIQSEHGNNTANYDEKYYHLSSGVTGYGWTLQAGYEKLGGDGTNSFKTPLATGHKFNGWADKFLSTPNQGLEDIYAKIAYRVSDTNSVIDGTKITAVYHDFEGDSSGDFGSETNLSIGKNFKLPDGGQPFKNINVLLKYADYRAEDAPLTDTQKAWLQISTKF